MVLLLRLSSNGIMSTELFDAFAPLFYEIKLRINPRLVFIQIFGHWHTDEQWSFEPEHYIVVIINTILKQEKIDIAFKIDK